MTIKEAYAKITSSEDLKKKAIDACKAGKGDEFLKEQGFDITIDQIKNYIESTKKGELSKEELNMAAGGCGDDCGSDVIWSICTGVIGCAISVAVTNADELDCTR